MLRLRWMFAIMVFMPPLANGQTPATQTTEQPKADVGSGKKLSDAALKYECKNGKNVRRIEIIEHPDAETRCKVQYTKDSENPGVAETLWNAKSDFNYCEEKASAFVSKLEGMGWTCAGQ